MFQLLILNLMCGLTTDHIFEYCVCCLHIHIHVYATTNKQHMRGVGDFSVLNSDLEEKYVFFNFNCRTTVT